MDTEDVVRLCEKLTINEDGVSEARMDPKIHELGIQRISLSLVGKIIANRKVNKEAFKATIPKIWRTVKEMEVESIAINTYIFIFKCTRDRKRILEGGPYYFDKQLIVLQEAEGLGKLSDANFKSFPIWIELYNVPLAWLNKDAGYFLGSMVGIVKEVNTGESGECAGSFIRARVLVDVSKPLIRGLRVKLEDDSCYSVVVCYKRLPNFCYFYGRIGHLISKCCDNVKGAVEGPDIKFGAWLRAPVVERARGLNWKVDRENNEGSKEVGGVGSFDSDMGIEVVRLEDEGKSEERREVPVTVEGPTSVKERVMKESILHLNSHDLLVGEKGSDTMCKPDPIGNVVRVLFGEETVMDSNSLCSEKDSLDRGYSVCHKPDDGGEVSSTKGRKWKRMARSQGSKAGGGHNSSLKRKRELCFDYEDRQQVKKCRTEVNMSDTAAVA
ncbi:hypothetical protein ACOSQ3_022927 [Xanthoceras sorbifolium]